MATDCVEWRRMVTCADSYESEGRLFESAWAHPADTRFPCAVTALALGRRDRFGPIETGENGF